MKIDATSNTNKGTSLLTALTDSLTPSSEGKSTALTKS